MERPALLALAALALAFAEPASAQAARAAQAEQPPQPTDLVPADVLEPNEQVRAFFERIEAEPLEAGLIGAMPAEEAAPMDSVIAQVYARGALTPGWQELGIDVEAHVASLDGGLAGNMIEGSNPFGLDRTYFGDRSFEAMIPSGYRLVARHGAPVEIRDGTFMISQISPKVIMAMRSATIRRGRASCIGRFELRLFSNPFVAASEMDSIAVIITLRTVATRGFDYCTVVQEQSPGRYRGIAFDPEGRRLASLDEALSDVRIVPVSAFPAPAPRR